MQSDQKWTFIDSKQRLKTKNSQTKMMDWSWLYASGIICDWTRPSVVSLFDWIEVVEILAEIHCYFYPWLSVWSQLFSCSSPLLKVLIHYHTSLFNHVTEHNGALIEIYWRIDLDSASVSKNDKGKGYFWKFLPDVHQRWSFYKGATDTL